MPDILCRSEAVCQPLPDFVTAERPAAFRPVPWREFMQARVAGVHGMGWGGRWLGQDGMGWLAWDPCAILCMGGGYAGAPRSATPRLVGHGRWHCMQLVP